MIAWAFLLLLAGAFAELSAQTADSASFASRVFTNAAGHTMPTRHLYAHDQSAQARKLGPGKVNLLDSQS